MGYTLLFYRGSCDALHDALLTMPPDLEARAFARWEALGGAEDEDDPRAIWESALEEIRRALGRDELSPSDAVPLRAPAQSAVVAIAESLGTLLGALNHSSAAGDLFRQGFLGGVAAAAFQEPDLARMLTARPFYGLAAQAYPGWGCLRAAEVARLLAQHRPPPAGSLDEDMRSWYVDLLKILTDAQRAGDDVITTYY